jgi:outer membrane protein TolC
LLLRLRATEQAAGLEQAQAAVQAAAAKEAQARAQFERILDMYERKAVARTTYDEATSEQAEENLRIARERYGVGLGTQTQLLAAETLRVQALKNRDDAVLDAGLAQLRLARASGSL